MPSHHNLQAQRFHSRICGNGGYDLTHMVSFKRVACLHSGLLLASPPSLRLRISQTTTSRLHCDRTRDLCSIAFLRRWHFRFLV
jgi:hypothetical protein